MAIGLHKSDVANPVLNWINSRLPDHHHDAEGVRDVPDAP